jgi:AAA15 family ATPase/GTPase
MPIDQLSIENFKGLGDKTDISIKPITIFIGANSSGKSSCIHALACLSQTLKITNNTRPLILDDDLAYVHLGRFIEVVHSKSYQDVISLGVSIKNATYLASTGVDDESFTKKKS